MISLRRVSSPLGSLMSSLRYSYYKQEIEKWKTTTTANKSASMIVDDKIEDHIDRNPGLKDDILKEFEFRSNTLNVSSVMELSNFDSTKAETPILTQKRIPHEEKNRVPNKNQVLSDLVLGLCGPNNSAPHDKGNPTTSKALTNKSDGQASNLQNVQKIDGNLKQKSQLTVTSLATSITDIEKENQPNNRLMQKVNSKGSLLKGQVQNTLTNMESESRESSQLGYKGGKSPSSKISILMPKNLTMTKEQVAFLGNLQNSLDVIGQMKAALDDARKKLEQSKKERESSLHQTTQLQQEIKARDETIASLRSQAARVVEDRNLLAVELAALKQQPLENQTKAERLEKECNVLRSKNKKLVVDQQVLQEIIKEMVFEKEQHLNNSSFHHRDANCLNEIELLYQRPDQAEFCSSRQTDLFHSFGESGVQLHHS